MLVSNLPSGIKPAYDEACFMNSIHQHAAIQQAGRFLVTMATTFSSVAVQLEGEPRGSQGNPGWRPRGNQGEPGEPPHRNS